MLLEPVLKVHPTAPLPIFGLHLGSRQQGAQRGCIEAEARGLPDYLRRAATLVSLMLQLPFPLMSFTLRIALNLLPECRKVS